MTEAQPFDVAIIGAGIVGASVACALAPHRRVLLLEAEEHPGYHTTGRSAALYAASYGPPQIRALTRASRAFFDAPPAGFAAVPLLRPRPSLFVAREHEVTALRELEQRLLAEAQPVRWLNTAQAQSLVPVLSAQACAGAMLDEGSCDVDVDALLQGFLRSARQQGAVLACSRRVQRLERRERPELQGRPWQLICDAGQTFEAAVIVNAAGAWADTVAALAGAQPQRVEPRRRSAFLFDAPAGVDTDAWPLVIAADESWYIKPDAGLLLGSPANADPVAAHDVVAEELDIALAIDRIESATSLRIRRPRRTWAGLRCFAPDGEPVIGFDQQRPDFFWATAVGGYGIQSSPAVGALCAALLTGQSLPAQLARQGLQPEALRPR